MQKWLEELCERRHEAFGMPLLAAGICGISATLVWLLQMSEEDAGYFGRFDLRSYARLEPSDDEAQQARAAFWTSLGWRPMAPPERQVQLWRQWGRGSHWQRIRLWSAGRSNWSPLTLFPELMAYVIAFGTAVMRPADQRLILVNYSVYLIIFFPVWSAAGEMVQQRTTVAIDSLRPVRRSQFLVDVGLAYAYRAAVEWGLNIIAWCGLAYVLVSADWREMLSVVVLTAAFQVLFFGLGAWVMRYVQFTNWAALFTFGLAGIFLTAFPPILWGLSIASFRPLLWVAPGIFVTGALIAWDAYRRWMRTEMG